MNHLLKLVKLINSILHAVKEAKDLMIGLCDAFDPMGQ
jgi:hypothetical protein